MDDRPQTYKIITRSRVNVYVIHGTKINKALSNCYENSHKTSVEFCMHVSCTLYPLVALFEYTILMFDLTGWRITYRNKRFNKTIR